MNKFKVGDGIIRKHSYHDINYTWIVMEIRGDAAYLSRVTDGTLNSASLSLLESYYELDRDYMKSIEFDNQLKELL